MSISSKFDTKMTVIFTLTSMSEPVILIGQLDDGTCSKSEPLVKFAVIGESCFVEINLQKLVELMPLSLITNTWRDCLFHR